jgi:predicted dehydrogenase
MTPDRRTFLAQSLGALAGASLFPILPARGATPHPGFRHRQSSVALVGAGRHGRAILDELLKLEVDVVAVCDAIESRARSGAERVGGARPYTDHRALLEAERDLGAVIVATPTHLHRDVAVDALGAGRHVYCEAPMAATLDDARAVAEAAGASDRVFQAGFLARSNPIYQRARLLVRTDSLRDTVALHAQHNRKTSWRFPAPEGATDREINWRLDPEVTSGLPGELGSHQFDVMAWMRGAMPERISGTGATRLHRDGRELPDTVHVRMVWDDGVPLHYQATLANSYGGEHEVIHGTEGAVRLAGTSGWMFKENDAAQQGWEVYATVQNFYNEDGIVLVADATQLAAQGRLQDGAALEHPPLYYGLRDWLTSIADGTPPACTAEDGLRSTALGILAHQAVMTGEEVTVPEWAR